MKNTKNLLVILAVLAFCSMRLLAQTTDDDLNTQDGKKNTKMGKCPDNKPFQKQIMDRLTPEERKKLKDMHSKNPEEFREEMFKRIRERRNEFEEKSSKSIGLAKKYHETSDETEKAKLKEQIIATLNSEFDEKMKKNRERLERAEKELQEFKKKIEEREKKREQIIQERINNLLTAPETKW